MRHCKRGKLRERVCARILRRNLKAADKCLKHVKIKAVQRFFEEFVSQLEIHITAGDLPGFYKHLKGIDLEGRRSRIVQDIRMKKVDYGETWDSFGVDGCSGLALYLILNRQHST